MIETYIFIPQVAHYVDVGSRVTHELPFEEGDVNDGGVKVDELEDEDFECQVVIKIRLSPMHF